MSTLDLLPDPGDDAAVRQALTCGGLWNEIAAAADELLTTGVDLMWMRASN